MPALAKMVLVAALAVAACSCGDVEQDSAGSVAAAATADSTGDEHQATTSVPTSAVPDTASTAAPTTPTPTISAPTTAAPATVAPATTPDGVTEDALTRFIAGVGTPLRGTALEGVVFAAPETYISLAQTACAQFSDGMSFDDVADDLLAEVGPNASEDDQRLVGAIIGAATRTICPEHAGEIGGR